MTRPSEGSPGDPAARLADVHSHLVPGVDDGARELAESSAAIVRLAAAGVDLVLTTPHLPASAIGRAAEFERLQRAVEEAWATVIEWSRRQHPGLALHLGREILLDSPVPEVDDPRVRLAGGRYVLVEFPRFRVPPRSEEPLHRIRGRGFVPVVAHVERYVYGEADPMPTVEEWRAAGAVLQVNAPSLVGKYGPPAHDLAWRLLEWGWVDLLASDYHSRGEPWIAEARAALGDHGGEEQLRVLFDVNPRRVVADRPLEPAPSLPARRGRWERLRGRLGWGQRRGRHRTGSFPQRGLGAGVPA